MTYWHFDLKGYKAFRSKNDPSLLLYMNLQSITEAPLEQLLATLLISTLNLYENQKILAP